MRTAEEIRSVTLFNHGLSVTDPSSKLGKKIHESAIESMEIYAEQFKQKWISINDELPEIGKQVQLLQDSKNPFYGFRVEHHTGKPLFGWMLGNRFCETFRVSHWCEMPSLPEKP